MKRNVTAYELVKAYRDLYATLPTVGVEVQELRYFADAHGYEMPDDDAVLSVCHQMRAWAQPVSGQAKLWEA